MSQIINNLYETFHYLSAVICQNLTTSKRCWQDNLEFHRCLVSYGNCSKMLPLFVATNIFMSKLSVADLRGILSRIFEHLSVIKIKQVSRFFLSKSKKYYTTTYFISQGINYDDGRIIHRLFVYSLVPPEVFAWLEYFAEFWKIYTLSGRPRLKTKLDQNLLDCGHMVCVQQCQISSETSNWRVNWIRAD